MDCDYCRKEFIGGPVIRTLDGLMHPHCYEQSTQDG